MVEHLGAAVAIFYFFCGVVLILWFLMPFAVFGVKKRIEETNRLLREIGLVLERIERAQPNERQG